MWAGLLLNHPIPPPFPIQPPVITLNLPRHTRCFVAVAGSIRDTTLSIVFCSAWLTSSSFTSITPTLAATFLCALSLFSICEKDRAALFPVVRSRQDSEISLSPCTFTSAYHFRYSDTRFASAFHGPCAVRSKAFSPRIEFIRARDPLQRHVSATIAAASVQLLPVRLSTRTQGGLALAPFAIQLRIAV